MDIAARGLRSRARSTAGDFAIAVRTVTARVAVEKDRLTWLGGG
jgi:hypothetical protein